MIEVETETSNLEGLASSLMLTRIDPGVERKQELIIAAKKGVLVDGVVAAIDLRIECLGGDDQTLVDGWNLEFNYNLQILSRIPYPHFPFLGLKVLPLDLQ